MKLEREFERIKLYHHEALQATAARVVLGSSVIRVFEKGTKKKMMTVLARIRIDGLYKVRNQRQFKLWFEKELNKVAVAVRKANRAYIDLRIKQMLLMAPGTSTLNVGFRLHGI